MAVRKFLDLSSDHFPVAMRHNPYTADCLTVYEWGEYGWMVWVPDDPDTWVKDYPADEHPPAEILVVQRYARSLDCDYILFDADGPHDPNLPSWEW